MKNLITPLSSLFLLLPGGLLASTNAGPAVGQIDVGRFSAEAGIGPEWELIQLSDKLAPTQYRYRHWDGVHAVEAKADAAMALLARPLNIDLSQTPVLCWRWRVEAALESADMQTKQGDDYAARVYVAFNLPPDRIGLGLRLKLGLARSLFGAHVPDAAINYVWDNRNPVGFTAPNAYTDQTRMIVANSGNQQAGQWVLQRQDVLADGSAAFDTQGLVPTLLAVASDTDNTGESALAGFADLHFVARDAACVFPADTEPS